MERISWKLSQMSPGKDSIPNEYHLWYYNRRVYETTTYLGVRTQKSVSDMWNYQEIIFELKPSLIIEFGSCYGGSGLFFASLLNQISPRGKVLSVDIDHSRLTSELKSVPNLEFLTLSSSDQRVASRISELRTQHPGRAFAILDSDHSKKHVVDEMLLLRPLLSPGDYMIVEDSNINGHPVLPLWGEGPYEAIIEYETRFPGDYVHDRQRELKFGFTFAPNGFLIRV